MNNEEKASKIAKQHKLNYTVRYNGVTYTDSSEAECYNSAMDMAQWKDERFSKFLLWLDDYFVIRKFDDGESMTYEELIDAFKDMNK